MPLPWNSIVALLMVIITTDDESHKSVTCSTSGFPRKSSKANNGRCCLVRQLYFSSFISKLMVECRCGRLTQIITWIQASDTFHQRYSRGITARLTAPGNWKALTSIRKYGLLSTHNFCSNYDNFQTNWDSSNVIIVAVWSQHAGNANWDKQCES